MIIRLKRKNDISFAWTLLLLVFLGHGILYFLSGATNTYYSYDNPIKAIKYIIVLIAVILMLIQRRIITAKDFIPVFITPVLVINVFFAHSEFNDYILLANYCVPIFTIMLYRILTNKVRIELVITFIYLFASVIGYVEFLFLKGRFGIFADVGYRACSIFVNPNNFGAYIFIATSIILTSRINNMLKLLALGNSYVLLGMSGSRSGLVMMTIAVLLIYGYYFIIRKLSDDGRIRVGFKSIIAIVLILAVISVLLVVPDILFDRIGHLLQGGRKLSKINLKVGRLYQLDQFFERKDFSILFPNRVDDIYTDNLFLHIWGFFGISVLLCYIGLTLWAIYKLWHKNKRRCLLMVLLFLFGVFENYLYLWPIAYIYWFIIAGIFFDITNDVICEQY